MTEIELKNLYNTSISFKLFVDKNAKSYNKTLDELWKDKIVQSYAQYIIDENRNNDKEGQHEVKKGYGC